MTTIRETYFYTLLYVDNDKSHVNLRNSTDPLAVYIGCAVLCARSFQYHGYRFKIITNRKDLLDAYLEDRHAGDVDVVALDFSREIPPGIRFRAAHYKLELYERFGKGEFGPWVGLVDADCIMLRPLDFPQVEDGTIVGYDITQQMVAEIGFDNIVRDLRSVSGGYTRAYRWFGGEFTVGSVEAFKNIARAVELIWPRYRGLLGVVHHVGDEMVLSAAVLAAGITVIDGGASSMIARWWTARTKFPQMSLIEACTRSILHLPSDKHFLADQLLERFAPETIRMRFEQVARRKLRNRRLFNLISGLAGANKRYVARIN